MAVTQNTYTGDGVTQNYAFTFQYLNPSHVKATINGTSTTAFTFFNASTLRFNTAPANGAAITIFRETPSSNLLADYTPGSALREADLELTLQQVLYVAQETQTFAENQSTAGLQDQITAANSNASTALTTANNAISTANTAAATANGLAASIDTANTNASTALSTANAASSTANGLAASISNANTLATSALNGFRNRFINGDMRVDQRNGGNSHTITNGIANASYGVDRWLVSCTGASVTGQRVQLVGANVPLFHYRITGGAGVTGASVEQRIEAAHVADLAGSAITFSADLACSQLTTVNWAVERPTTTNNDFSARTSIATGSFTVNSTLTRYSATVTLPSAATTGVVVRFSVGALTSGTFTIGNAQFEAGSTATTFERRPLITEILLCQRYYQNFDISLMLDQCSHALSTYVKFTVPMRAVPTINPTGFRYHLGIISGLKTGLYLETNISVGTKAFDRLNDGGFLFKISKTSQGTPQYVEYAEAYTASIEL